MNNDHWMHVKIKSDHEELYKNGIFDLNHRKIMLSDRAFPVEKRVKAENGRMKLLLTLDDRTNISCWLYEDMTEAV